MRRYSDEPQRPSGARLPRAVRHLHAGTHRHRLRRRIHARRATSRYRSTASRCAGSGPLPDIPNSSPLSGPASGSAPFIGHRARVLGARRRLPLPGTTSRGREALTALFMSPLMIPHVVLGIAFLRFFTQIGLGSTFLGLLLAHVVVVFPFALRLSWRPRSAWIAPSSRRPSRSARPTGWCSGA